MGNTLFIYRDAVTKKVAVTAGSVLAMSAYKAAGETADAQKYARLILVVSAGARTADYAAPVRAFAGKEIICFFVGLTKDEGTSFQAAVAGSSGKTFYISAESLTEDTLAAASALLPKKAETADPADIVIAAIQRFCTAIIRASWQRATVIRSGPRPLSTFGMTADCGSLRKVAANSSTSIVTGTFPFPSSIPLRDFRVWQVCKYTGRRQCTYPVKIYMKPYVK